MLVKETKIHDKSKEFNKLFKKSGLTLKELSNRAGFVYENLSHIRHGRRSISMEKYNLIKQVLNDEKRDKKTR